jgi:hypothetical protein
MSSHEAPGPWLYEGIGGMLMGLSSPWVKGFPRYMPKAEKKGACRHSAILIQAFLHPYVRNICIFLQI